jgi:hypothetical protein
MLMGTRNSGTMELPEPYLLMKGKLMNWRIEKIKDHISEHRIVYITAGVSFALGGISVLVLKSRPTQVINTVAPVIAPIFNNTNNVTLGGYAHKVVKCLETDQIWESVTKAAEDIGATVPVLSRVLNGHTRDFAGKHYTIIALGCAA